MAALYTGPVHNPTPLALRVLWLTAGFSALALGLIGIFVPLLPTTPFVLLAAFCFARGSQRCEAWLLNHRTLGPMVHNWRERRAIPLRAKQLAWVMMIFGCAMAAWRLPLAWSWIPAAVCLCVAVWMYRLPSR